MTKGHYDDFRVELGNRWPAILRWIQIREVAGYGPPTVADIHHSSLLLRLLEGKEPLDVPPPRAYSYPWYDLIETGRADGVEVYFHDDFVSINQSPWRFEREDDEHYFVHHPGAPGKWQLVRGTTTLTSLAGAFKVGDKIGKESVLAVEPDKGIDHVTTTGWSLVRIRA